VSVSSSTSNAVHEPCWSSTARPEIYQENPNHAAIQNGTSSGPVGKPRATQRSATFSRANISVNRHEIEIRMRETEDDQPRLRDIAPNDTISEYEYVSCFVQYSNLTLPVDVIDRPFACAQIRCSLRFIPRPCLGMRGIPLKQLWANPIHDYSGPKDEDQSSVRDESH
jgi:hypothetical protein